MSAVKSLETLYAEIRPRIISYLGSMGASKDDSEEAFASACEIVVAGTAEGHGPAHNTAGYLYTIAKRELFKLWETQKETVTYESSPDEALASTEPCPLQVDLQQQLATKAFMMLAEDERRLLWDIVGKSMSQEDLAKTHDIPAPTLRKRVSRARVKFRELYLEEYARGSQNPKCQQFVQLLAQDIMGNSSSTRRQLIAQHLGECDSCVVLADNLRDEGAQLR